MDPDTKGMGIASKELLDSVGLGRWTTSPNTTTKEVTEAGKTTRRLQRSSSHGQFVAQKTMSLHRKGGPRMQLPSFEKLGISAHNPSYFDLNPKDVRPGGSRSQSQRSSHRSEPPALETSMAFLGSSPLLTPPHDVDSIKWNNAVQQTTENAANPSASSSQEMADKDQIRAPALTQASITTCGESNAQSSTAEQTEAPSSDLDPTPRAGGNDLNPDETSDSFLNLGIGANISSVSTPDAQHNGITVVSQTLPHPLEDTKFNTHTAFTSMIEAIQSRFDNLTNPPYIRITHAVPPQFTLRNLPSSPPSTPSRQGGEDYFSLNVFANAAAVPNYHTHDGNVDRSAPPSPAPIVPPSSVQVALVERYIPPSTAQEYTAFFSTNGPSVLVDRLFELSSNGGSLMLIYPTKRGAESFRSQYVGPLLDNLLRTMVVVHDMSSDFASSLGRMPAIAQMLPFEGLKDQVEQLCRQLSRGSSSPSRRAQYSLVYANQGQAPLDRKAWSEWFLQQETTRMKAALKAYWQRGQKLPTSKDGVIPATLMRDIKICVEEGMYEYGMPHDGVEVGVFVIRRSP